MGKKQDKHKTEILLFQGQGNNLTLKKEDFIDLSHPVGRLNSLETSPWTPCSELAGRSLLCGPMEEIVRPLIPWAAKLLHKLLDSISDDAHL